MKEPETGKKEKTGKSGYSITTWRLHLWCRHPEWLRTTQEFYNRIAEFYYNLLLDHTDLWEMGSQQTLRELEIMSIPGRGGRIPSDPLPWQKVPLYFRRAAANEGIASAKSYISRFAQDEKSGRAEKLNAAVTYYKGMYQDFSAKEITLRVWTGDTWTWMHCRLSGRDFPENVRLMSPSVVFEYKYDMLHVPVRQNNENTATVRQRMQAGCRILCIQFTNSDAFAAGVVQALAVVLIYLCLQPFSSSEYKIYLLIGVVLNIFSGLLMQFARGLGDMLAYSVSSFLTAASTVVLNVVFVAVLKLGAHGMFIATMCGIAINCIYLFFKLKAWKYYKPKLVDLSLIKEVCGYSLPLVPNQISGWILSASDRTIIAKFLSVAENGVYSVANKFSNLVGTFYGFFNLAWVETVSVHYNDSDRDEFIGDMMETVSNLFVSICVGIIAIMPFVFPVMVNQQYGNAYYQIPILLIAVIFQILVGLYSAIYIALKKSSTIARTTIAGAIINVLVNLALIRFIGLYAASISTLVSYASTALYRRIDIRKYIKIKVNVKNILLNSVAVVFVTLSYYFNITILNVAALVIACIYAVGINWKLIKMFFAEIRKYKKEGN